MAHPAKWEEEDKAYEYIRKELIRYVPTTQLANRIEDRLTECRAKGLNPLEWVYCESTETVNYKTATYFHWEKKR